MAEHFDGALLAATGILSGHSIKNLLSGLATFWMVVALLKQKRRRVGQGEPDSS